MDFIHIIGVCLVFFPTCFLLVLVGGYDGLKEKFKSRRGQEGILATIMVITGLSLMWGAFWAPPVGQIHPSILGACGEVFTFAGAVIGIDYHYRRD